MDNGRNVVRGTALVVLLGLCCCVIQIPRASADVASEARMQQKIDAVEKRVQELEGRAPQKEPSVVTRSDVETIVDEK